MTQKQNALASYVGPVLLLLLAPLLLFAPVVGGDSTLLPADALTLFEPFRSAAPTAAPPHNPLLSDLVLQNYPWQRLITRALAEGEIPWWDPFIFSGHPFLANGQAMGLYPLRVIFHLLPLPQAYGIFIVVQLGLAGVWMYVLARVLGANRLGGLLAGLTFELSGFLVVSVVHPMIIAAASWLPLLLALAELTLRRAPFLRFGRSTLPWALLGALALLLELLAGHAEIAYFALLVLAAFVGYRLLYRLATLPKTAWRAEVLAPALSVALSVVLGLGLSAVQYLPLYEVVGASFRQGAVSLQDVLGWAYPKRRVLAFVIPNFFGNPTHRAFQDIFTGETIRATVNAYGNPVGAFDWGIKNYVEGGTYMGLLPLALALLAVLDAFRGPAGGEGIGRRFLKRVRQFFRQPYTPFFTLLALFALGCIFGTPLYALVYALPLLNQSHSPFRWVFPLTIAVAALAGLGATAVSTSRKPTAGSQGPAQGEGAFSRAVRWLGWGLLGSGGVLLAGLWASRLAFSRIEPWVTRLFWALAKAPDVFPDARTFYAYEFRWIQQAALLLIVTGAVLRLSRCPIFLPRRLGRRPLWEALAVVVLIADLFSFGWGFNPQADPAPLSVTPAVVEFLRQDTGVWRFSSFDPHGSRVFNANTGMYFDFQDVRGYDSTFSAQYVRYMNWIEPQGQLLYNRIAPFTQFSSLDSPLTDLLNVKYLITEEEIPLPKYRLVYEQGTLRVYENLTVMPRAFTLPQSATLVVPDAEAVGTAIRTYDPRFYVIIEAAEEAWSGSAPAAGAWPRAFEAGEPQAQVITSYGLNQVVVDANVGEEAWLVLGDAFFPGWKAFVRAQGAAEDTETEVPIARVAGNFRGVRLAPGAWTVRFRYTPNSVKFGAFSSFLAGMMVIFLAVTWSWRRLYREDANASTTQRLAKNSIAPIALNLFNRLVDFAFAALMLRILGPDNAGQYYYAISVFMWFDIITNFGLNTYLTREVSRYRDQARRYLANTSLLRIGLAVLAVPLLAGFIALRQTVIAALTTPAAQTALLALALLYVGLLPSSMATGFSALFYAYEKAEFPAAVTTVSTLIKVGLGTGVLLAGFGIVGLAATSIATNVITLAILGILAWRQIPELHLPGPSVTALRAAPERALRRQMLGESWPLMVNHLLATLFFKVDVPLMEAILGNEILGLYSTGYKYLDALNVIPAMFTMALFPIISRKAVEDRAGFVRFFRLGVKILMLLVLPAAIVATLGARELVLLLGGPEYLPGGMIALQLMAWSMVIGWINSLIQYVLIALNQQRYLTRAYLAALSFNLIANLLLMPRFGYQASALLHTAAELMLFVPFVIGLQRQIGRLDWWGLVGKPLAAVACAAPLVALLLPVSRLAALVGALLVYGIAIWRLRLFDAEEREALAPVLRHRGQA